MTIRSAIPLLLIFFFSILQMDCKNDPPVVPPQPSIIVSDEDIGVTEVRLKIATQHIILPSSVTLQRNGTTLTTFTLTTSDTLIADTTVLPKQSYAYTAIIQDITSNRLQVTTMDTTSHNFTWQTFTFGGEPGTGSSVLYDVAIVNDSLAYAVGEIYVLDSTGQPEPKPYNFLLWNGQTWEQKKIPTATFGGSIANAPLRTVFAFNANDVWTFSTAGSYSHWNGIDWTTAYVAERNGGGVKIWGTSSQDLYLVGTNGSISHYNGNSWTKIESGTTVDIHDIFGSQLNNNEFEIIAAGGNNGSVEKIILQISDNAVQKLSDEPLQYPINGIWFSPHRQYYVVGAGIYQKRVLSDSIWRNSPLQYTTFYTRSICGTDINNIFIAGDFGELLHYNGVFMKSFRLDINPVVDMYQSIDVNNKFVVVVGTVGLKAVITVGHQQ